MDPNNHDAQPIDESSAGLREGHSKAGAAREPTSRSLEDVVTWELNGVITLRNEEDVVLREASFWSKVSGRGGGELGEVVNRVISKCEDGLDDPEWIDISFFHLEGPLETEPLQLLDRVSVGRDLPACARISAILRSDYSKDIPLKHMAHALVELGELVAGGKAGA